MKTPFLAGLLLIVLASEPLCAQTGRARREAWTTSRLVGSPELPKRFVTEPVFRNLVFDQPLEVVAIPGTNRLAVVEVAGKIYTIENRPEAETHEKSAFADITKCDPNFSRLYGLAFHPRFAENGYCYVSYVLKDKLPEGSRVSRFKVTGNPPQIDLGSEQVLIRWYSGGHNGAHLQFGPDGYFYITTGDAGDAFPPDGRNTGQNIGDLEASILRIDVDRAEGGRPYRIPDDNPFVKHAGARGEVWAYGLRNPWKMCFDPADGSLWTGDVGWEMWEMVYRIERGGNYGWSVVEGPQRVHLERLQGPSPILPPAIAHSHIESRSITGGYFSQSSRLPELRGAYIYGDYVTGKIWGLRHEGENITWREELVDSPLQIVSFGLDQAGEVLIVDYPSGTFHRLANNPRQTANANFPKKLSETGLFEDTARHRVAPGVIPYSINAEPWADGTTAERFVALPGESKLGVYKTTNAQVGYFAGDWQFPDGAVLAKTVSMELEAGNKASWRRLETQVLHFDVDSWKAYNYLWNEGQTDAVLAEDVGSDRKLVIQQPAGGTRSVPTTSGQQQTWHHASRTECKLCHTTRVGTLLGFRPAQLERQHDYGGTLADQLGTLEHVGLFAEPLAAKRDAWVNPRDDKAPLEQRARVYLHVNCGHCHTRGGGGSSFFDVQMRVMLARTSLIGSRPTQGTFGILGAEVVAAGDPSRSLLYYRMSKLGHGRMPQFGSQVVDLRGTRLMHEWIASIVPMTDDAARGTIQRLRKEEQAALASLKELANDLRGAEKPLARLLSSPSAALQLADAIASGQLPISVQRVAIERGAAQSEPAIRDLFERFIPEEQRVKRLGTDIRPEEILAIAGDAARGRELFLNIAGVQCKNCHKVGDQGQALGPDLTQIGKKLDKTKLLESILEPSKTIDPQYVGYLIETKEGEVLTGLLVKRTDGEVVLKQADNKEVRMSAGQIERMAPQQKSLMPDLLLRDLTTQQVADLLAFLAGLK
jgi:putative heme-binding domain-containing protein